MQIKLYPIDLKIWNSVSAAFQLGNAGGVRDANSVVLFALVSEYETAEKDRTQFMLSENVGLKVLARSRRMTDATTAGTSNCPQVKKLTRETLWLILR